MGFSAIVPGTPWTPYRGIVQFWKSLKDGRLERIMASREIGRVGGAFTVAKTCLKKYFFDCFIKHLHYLHAFTPVLFFTLFMFRISSIRAVTIQLLYTIKYYLRVKIKKLGINSSKLKKKVIHSNMKPFFSQLSEWVLK